MVKLYPINQITTIKSNTVVVLYILGLTILQLFQASFTELANDEAYYWMYAKRLDWGYFDHPPMVALGIRLGIWFGHATVFVRMSTLLWGAMTCWGLWNLCNRRHSRVFILMHCSILAFQLYGFIAIPDAPLLAFGTWFFVCYRNYLLNDSWKNQISLSLIITGLLYSKYHGLLIVIFTIIAQPFLWKKRSFYSIFTLSLLLYLPHIYWQIENNFPSWHFHVLNKSQSSYNIIDSIFLPLQILLMAGPFQGILLWIGLIKTPIHEPLQKVYLYCFWGFFCFFFLSSFNAAVEANWMAASVIPLFLGGYNYIFTQPILLTWSRRLGWITLIILFFFRINLMTNVCPALGSKVMPEFYGWKSWSEIIHEEAKGLPVAIMNSYQKASKYAYYQNTEALSLNNPAYRRNQYDIWDIAASMQGKTVALFLNYDYGPASKQIETSHGVFHFMKVPNFRSYQYVHIQPEQSWINVGAGENFTLKIQLNQGNKNLEFNYDPNYPPKIVAHLYYYEQYVKSIDVAFITPKEYGKLWNFNWQTIAPTKPGPYYLKFGIQTGNLPSTINSPMIRMDVE